VVEEKRKETEKARKPSENKKKPPFTQTILERALRQLDETYLAERKAECERLHNRLAEVIAEERASPQNTLYVLKILEFEVLQGEYQKIFGAGSTAIPSAPPMPITGEKEEGS